MGSLGLLAKRFAYISDVVPDRPLWIVGGAVRDTLLGRASKLDDIDVACAGTPTEIYPFLDGHQGSSYKTDKYGTMTLIDDNISYEITPFRSETTYTDNRHPDEITRSDSLIEDAKRRDFTINALYYHCVFFDTPLTTPHHPSGQSPVLLREDEDMLCCCLGPGFDAYEEVLDHTSLKKTIATGQRRTAPQRGSYRGVHIIADPTGGYTDMLARTLVCVGDPVARFSEDGLRVIRAVRIVNILNQDPAIITNTFDFATPTWLAMKKCYYMVWSVAIERIKDEVLKVFHGTNPSGFVAVIAVLGLLEYIFPHVARTQHVDQPVRYHTFDVYAHTMLVLYHGQQFARDRRVRLALLYHDVGKPDQYHYATVLTTDEERKRLHASPLSHPQLGAEMAQKDLRRLGIARKDISIIHTYIAHHMAPGMVANGTREQQTKKLRARVSERGPEITKDLLDITIADRAGQCNPLQYSHTNDIELMKELVDEIVAAEGRFQQRDLCVDGNDIMHRYNLAPGPVVGQILQKVFSRVLDNVGARNRPDVIYNYIDHSILPTIPNLQT